MPLAALLMITLRRRQHRYQTIASLPAPAFETHIARTKAAGMELTSAGVYREVFSISVRAEGMRANRVMILFTPARHEADGIGSP
jgi:hypothetical protein